MEALTETQIRSAFVNCSKGAAARMSVPHGLDEQPWKSLDYFGWRDPHGSAAGYLVAEHDAHVRGVLLRAPEPRVGVARRSMCSLCMSVRSGGVSLMVAPRAGKAGRQGHSIGTYMCSDLRCSLRVRGHLPTDGAQVHETLSVDDKVARLQVNLEAFLRRLMH